MLADKSYQIYLQQLANHTSFFRYGLWSVYLWYVLTTTQVTINGSGDHKQDNGIIIFFKDNKMASNKVILIYFYICICF